MEINSSIQVLKRITRLFSEILCLTKLKQLIKTYYFVLGEVTFELLHLTMRTLVYTFHTSFKGYVEEEDELLLHGARDNWGGVRTSLHENSQGSATELKLHAIGTDEKVPIESISFSGPYGERRSATSISKNELPEAQQRDGESSRRLQTSIV